MEQVEVGGAGIADEERFADLVVGEGVAVVVAAVGADAVVAVEADGEPAVDDVAVDVSDVFDTYATVVDSAVADRHGDALLIASRMGSVDW